MSDIADKITQNVFLYDRKRLSVSGIASVDSFDESCVCATTVEGLRFVAEGSGISLTDVNLDNKCFEAVGEFNSYYYCEQQRKSIGVFNRLFKAR